MGIFAFHNMILNMSITGSVVILVVLAARLLLRKAPRVFSYALWSVVLFRLLCPISIAADFSLMGLLDVPAVENTQYTSAVEYIPSDIGHVSNPEVRLPVPSVINDAVNEVLPQEYAVFGMERQGGEFSAGSVIWVSGIVIMLIYGTVTYFLLRRRLIGAVRLRDNIYLADGIESPFVLGIFRPGIYLPSVLSKQEQRYIILHERHHIRRGDHIIKVLAFIALCIHWFNPLVWAAFHLASKDMEMSCDEAVIKKLGETIRTDYSESLLSLATGRRTIAGTPLAFGEGDTKSRIKNVLNWKKAKPTVIFISALVVVFALIFCGTNSVKNDSWITAKYGADSVALECSLATPINSYAIYEDIYKKGELISSEVMILDRFQEEGGATPRRTSLTLNAQTVSDGEGGFAGELSVCSQAAGTAYMTRKLPEDHYTGAVHVTADIGDGIFGRRKVETEDSITLLTILLTTEPEGKIVVESRDGTLIQNNDTAVIYRLVTSEDGIHFTDDETAQIRQTEAEIVVDEPSDHDSDISDGGEYIADAISRGIDVYGKADTYLCVYLISEQYGEIAERIALTWEEAATILAEEKVMIEEGFGFSATLHVDGQTAYYNEHSGIPQTVLDLAVERCNYHFAAPEMITGSLQEARLDCDWLETPLYAGKEHLPRLLEILKNAEFGYVGGCGYGARLTLISDDGEEFIIFKGTDGCDTIVFGSYSGYFLGDKENTEFWEMFGLDPESKLPQEKTSVGVSEGLQ